MLDMAIARIKSNKRAYCKLDHWVLYTEPQTFLLGVPVFR